jgi:tetratricopeptide (TPR) repeat protein
VQVELFRIFVASPMDVQEERALLPQVIEGLNRDLGDRFGFRIVLLRWETDAYPGFHPKGPQGLIDARLPLEQCDVVIGIFWKRFGTPTADAQSGTESEIKRACLMWKQNGRPKLMVYFNFEEFSPSSQEERAQLDAVLDFRQNFPPEGLWWSYVGTAEFESLVRDHLTRLLLERFGPRISSSSLPDLGIFDAPQFGNQVDRRTLFAQLADRIQAYPVVSVEGLPGSGKTYLVSTFLREKAAGGGGGTLWYDPQKNETLDGLLAHLEARMPLLGFSAIAKAKDLLHQLGQQGLCLVIDDFHLVDASFLSLIGFAVRSPGPARIILISRTFVDLLREFPQIGHLEVRGFDLEELRAYLTRRGLVGLSAGLLAELRQKIDGLPLAASLFATLVREFGYQPTELLQNSTQSLDRLRGWFDEVLARTNEEDAHLLRWLSVCDGPFDLPLVRALATEAGLSQPERSFEQLQRSYLVQKHTELRWSIHNLISIFCLLDLPHDERQRIHLTLARHYLKGLSLKHAHVLSEEEFLLKVKACRELQQAGEHRNAQRLIQNISKTAKSRGRYEAFRQLSSAEVSADVAPSGWLVYDHAHCCLILGKIEESYQVLEHLLYASSVNLSLKVAGTRLYAETLAAMGRQEQALTALSEVLEAVEGQPVRLNILAQARATEAKLLIDLQRFKDASSLTRKLLAESERRQDPLGIAVSLTHLGIISYHSSSLDEASQDLARAVALFRDAQDRRGTAWSLLWLSLCKAKRGEVEEAVQDLEESLATKLDIGECLPEYLDELLLLRHYFSGQVVLLKIESEICRVRDMLGDLVREARMTRSSL